MRAVNLIPADERRGAGGAAGKSGGAVYVLLGMLGLIVVMATAYVLAGKNLNDKKAELTRVTNEAQSAEAKANALSAYTQFSALRANRVETVSSLAASRFDWSHALHEVARVVPDNAWLTTLVGSTAPGISVQGASTGASQLRAALSNPAIEISGCTTSQKSVARMLTRMRLIDGVERVSLADAEKADSGGAGDSAGASGGDCRNGSDKFPKFDLVVFFKGVGVSAAAVGTAQQAAQTTTATGQTSTTPSATSTTPTTTTTSSSSSSSSSQPASGGTTP